MKNKVIARPRTTVVLSLGNSHSRISINIRPSQKWEVFVCNDTHKIIVNGKTKMYMTNKDFDELFEMEG